MSKVPLYFPKKGEKPSNKGRTWYNIPYFSGYQISIPQMEVKDMRWEDCPEGRLLPMKIAEIPVSRRGQLYTRMLADDGVLYKSFVTDLFDLVVKENNKDNYQKRRPNKLPLSFKPVGSRNYKEQNDKVKEFWRDIEYACTKQ